MLGHDPFRFLGLAFQLLFASRQRGQFAVNGRGLVAGEAELFDLLCQSCLNRRQLAATLLEFRFQRVGSHEEFGAGLGSRMIVYQLLDARVRTRANPDDEDQPNNDPDHVGDDVEERIETERDFPGPASASVHGSTRS